MLEIGISLTITKAFWLHLQAQETNKIIRILQSSIITSKI